MAKTWVLHTETKGTGAQMVPLERTTKRSSDVEPVFVPRKPAPPSQQPMPEAPAPHRFRIVDLMTRETIADDVSTRDAVDALKGIRSIVDVNVYVWREEQHRWRLLTLPEQRTMWALSRS
jgi:hypothetical protein